MTVYVLFHADIEDDRYVRGVYANKELAEEALVWDEYRDGYRRGHHVSCCYVDEMELLDHVELPFHGPEHREMRPPSPLAEMMFEFMRPNLLRSLIKEPSVALRHDWVEDALAGPGESTPDDIPR
jgi:hypothetical protein